MSKRSDNKFVSSSEKLSKGKRYAFSTTEASSNQQEIALLISGVSSSPGPGIMYRCARSRSRVHRLPGFSVKSGLPPLVVPVLTSLS